MDKNKVYLPPSNNSSVFGKTLLIDMLDTEKAYEIFLLKSIQTG